MAHITAQCGIRSSVKQTHARRSLLPGRVRSIRLLPRPRKRFPSPLERRRNLQPGSIVALRRKQNRRVQRIASQYLYRRRAARLICTRKPSFNPPQLFLLTDD
ncbi:MAG TPA: hypothetical protein VN678_08100 [Acidobacteriaceae bacterium]|nr:hypothetical protein [Acidobacteriaceae bacterium]